MRSHKFLSVIAVSSAVFLMTGCGKGPIDAEEYSKALLDYEFKGDIKTYAALSGENEDVLARQYQEDLSTIADVSGYDSQSYPVSDQLAQDYRTVWENVRNHSKYEVKNAKKDGDSYQVTLDLYKMNLFAPGNDILSQKWEDYVPEENGPAESPSILNLQFLIESWNQVLEDVTYQKPETVTVILSRDENGHWGFSDQDMEKISSMLLDQPEVSDPSAAPDFDPSNEGTPDMELPEDLSSMENFQAGDRIPMTSGGSEAAFFTLENVKVTKERIPDQDYQPEKVILVTYSYENTGMDDAVLIDDMSLQVLENDQVCQPYYIADLISTDSALKNEGPVTSCFTYEVSSSCSEIDLVVSYPWFDKPVKIHASVEE